MLFTIKMAELLMMSSTQNFKMLVLGQFQVRNWFNKTLTMVP